MQADTLLRDLPRGLGADQPRAATAPAPQALRGSCGPQSAPPELVAFCKLMPACEAAQALGVSRRQVHRLAQGYWPSDARAIMRAWSAYAGISAGLRSRWFLRRVRLGGLVRHGQGTYTGHDLVVRVGQLVAVARAADGGLLAQTLELPITRLPLSPAAPLTVPPSTGDAA